VTKIHFADVNMEERVTRDYPDALMSTHNLPLAFFKQERWSEAEELNLQVLKKRRRVLGEEHQDTLMSIHNLASTFFEQEQWSESEVLNLQVLERRRGVLGEEHPAPGYLVEQEQSCNHSQVAESDR
jgi:hypothetical protein